MPYYPNYPAANSLVPGDKVLFYQNSSTSCKTADFQKFADSVIDVATQLSYPFIFVDDYGAVGNGTTDDTVAITNALAAAGANSVVVFGSGKTYLTTATIAVPSNNITLLGYGASVISNDETKVEKFAFVAKTSGRVTGLNFDCAHVSGALGLSPGIISIADSSDIFIDNCSFSNTGYSGVYVVGQSARISVTNCKFYKCFLGIFSDDDAVLHMPTDLVISNNTFRTGLGTTTTAYSGAIKISGIGSATSRAGHIISDNIIDTAGQMGIEIQTWINDCTISNNSIVGVGYGISISGCSRVNVSGNVVKNAVTYGIETASTSSYITLSNNTITSTGTSIDLMLVVDCNNVNFTGSVLKGGNNALKLQTSSKCVFSSNVVDSPAGSAVNVIGSTDIVISSNEFNCTGFGFIFIDSASNAVARILIEANLFRGTVTNNGITLYAPNAPTIRDVQAIGNNTVAMVCPGGAWNTASTATPATKLIAIRSINNVGLGEGGNEVTKSLNLNYYETSTSFSATYWDYFWWDGGIIAMDATAGNKTVPLPDATWLCGYTLTVMKIDASGNTVTLDGFGAQPINGSATKALAARWDKYTIRATGSQVTGGAQWVIVA